MIRTVRSMRLLAVEISPGWDGGVVKTAKKAGVPVVPGVVTPSEVQRAMRKGLRVLKLFPAGIAGGVPMLKAMASVYPDVSFVPTGGVSAGNLAEWHRHVPSYYTFDDHEILNDVFGSGTAGW